MGRRGVVCLSVCLFAESVGSRGTSVWLDSWSISSGCRQVVTRVVFAFAVGNDGCSAEETLVRFGATSGRQKNTSSSLFGGVAGMAAALRQVY